MTIAGLCSSTRASATSWRWPIERPRPPSPTCGLQPVRQRLEPVAAADAPRDLRDLVVGRVGPGVADVVGHRAGEEERRLRHDAQLPPVVGQVEGADVVPVDQDLAALELVEARDQLAKRRLARAGVPDERERLPGGNRQVEVAQDRLLIGVAEVDIAELDLARPDA